MTAASFCPALSSNFVSMRLMIASGDVPINAGRYNGKSSAAAKSRKIVMLRTARARRDMECNAIALAVFFKRKLRDAAAAIFVFLAATARARIVPAHFGPIAAHRRQIESHLAVRIAIVCAGDGSSDWLSLPPTLRSIDARRRFAQQKLWKRGQKILECLQIRRATEKIVQHFIL